MGRHAVLGEDVLLAKQALASGDTIMFGDNGRFRINTTGELELWEKEALVMKKYSNADLPTETSTTATWNFQGFDLSAFQIEDVAGSNVERYFWNFYQCFGR